MIKGNFVTRLAMTRAQRGQSLVIVALLMVGLLGMAGLAIDGGRVFTSRRNGQNAADAAAFGGVRVLAVRADDSVASEQQVWNAVLTFTAANGVAGTEVVATLIEANGADICRLGQNCNGVPTTPLATGVRVTTTVPTQPYFVSVIIGNQDISIRSVAAAQSGPPTAAIDLMPMSLRYECAVEPCFKTVEEGGSEYVLFGDPQTGGNFQWTNYSYPCQTDSPDLVDYLLLNKRSGSVVADPYNLMMDPTSPAWICGYTGVNTAKQVRDALDWWLAKPEAERHWIIPIYNTLYSQGGNVRYHVIMFADFVPTGYDFGGGNYNPTQIICNPADPKPTDKCIKGKFFKKAMNLSIKPGRCPAFHFDACGIGLSQ